MSLVFAASSIVVLPLWALMVALPHWGVTRRVLSSVWSVVAVCALYAALVLPRMAELLPLLSRPELSTIAPLLGTEAGATIAWVHFLAFDLFVGRWIYLDAQTRGASALWVSLVLVLTLMFGPLGLLTYLALRAALRRRSSEVTPATTATEGLRP